MTSRRRFLTRSAGAALLALGAPYPFPAMANPLAGGKMKFIFVFNQGGWDPTRVLAPAFDIGLVHMEADGEVATAGGIPYVSHSARPSVTSFMNAWHDRMVVFNGLMVRSIAHEICTMISMTGDTIPGVSDWPARLAAARREDFILPHIVVDGPSYPGDRTVSVARTGSGGQLEALLSGETLTWGDTAVAMPEGAEALLDAFVQKRAAARAALAKSSIDQRLTADLVTSLDQATRLKTRQGTMSFDGGMTVGEQIPVAVQALATGISRCATVAHRGQTFGWDTHANNDADQSPMWEELFNELGGLMDQLADEPGEEDGNTLLDETVVVVVSEMGRTPYLNEVDGKEHWPYTSAMVVGPGLNGDRVIGAWDENFYGRRIDFASGDVSDDGEVLSAEAFGATLLALADLDPAEHVDTPPITAAIA